MGNCEPPRTIIEESKARMNLLSLHASLLLHGLMGAFLLFVMMALDYSSRAKMQDG